MNRKPYRTLREAQKWEARQFREAGMPIANCAKYFDVSVATLMRGLADMRAKFGPEKLPPHLRHRVRLRVENSGPRVLQESNVG